MTRLSPKRGLRTFIIKNKYELFLFFGFFIFNIVIATMYRAPVSYPDEYGVLMTANHLYGGVDWQGSIYYGYTSAPLIGWVFLLFEDIRSIYFGVLFVKSILISLVPVFCYKLLNEVLMVDGDGSQGKFRALFSFRGRDFGSREFKVFLSAAISLYPALTMYSKRSCNETMLHLSLFICFYLIGKSAFCNDKVKLRIYSAFLGFFAVFAYATHGMGLSFIAAILMIIPIAHILTKKALVSYPFFLASFLTFFFIDSRIKAYLMEVVFQRAEGDLKNTFAYSFNRMMETVFNTEGLKTFIKSIVSRIHYMSTATFGLFLLLAVILLVFVFLYMKKRFALQKDLRKSFAPTQHERAEMALAIFSFLIIACGVGLSTLNHIQVTQQRHGIYYFYGRYFEYMVLPLILFGLYYLFTKGIKKRQLLVSAGISASAYVLMAVFMQRFVVPFVTMKGATTKRHMIYGVLPFTGSSVSELTESGNFNVVQYSMIALGIAGLGGLIVMTFLLFKKYHKLALILLCGLFLYGTAFNLAASGILISRMNYNRYYAPLEVILEDFKEIEDVYDEFPTLYFVSRKNIDWSRRVQLTFNRYSVASSMHIKRFEDIKNPQTRFNNAIIIADNDFELEKIDAAYQKILSTENSAAWIRGNEIREYWANRPKE